MVRLVTTVPVLTASYRCFESFKGRSALDFEWNVKPHIRLSLAEAENPNKRCTFVSVRQTRLDRYNLGYPSHPLWIDRELGYESCELRGW